MSCKETACHFNSKCFEPRQRRGGSWHPEVPGGNDPRSRHGASSEGQSGASPRELGGS